MAHPSAAPSAPRNLLVIGGIGLGDPGRCLLRTFLAQAEQRGCRIHMTDQKMFVDLAPTEVTSRFASLHVLDFTDTAHCVEWATRQHHEGPGFDMVVTARDDAQPTTAAIAEALGLPYNSPASIETTQNKDRCRAALAEAGLPQPAWRLCRDVDDALAFTEGTAGPWVVKPRDGTGSRAVRRADDRAALVAAVGLLDAADRPFLVEELVVGPEYSAEGLFLHGEPVVVALTAKTTTEPPLFVELGHVVPAPLPEDTAAAARTAVERAVRAVGLTFGLFHAEFWLTENGPVLGELHCRPGGDYISMLVEAAHPGFQYFGALFDAFADPAFRPDLAADGAAAVAFLTAPAGTVVEVSGWEQARAGEALLHAHLARSPGDTVPELRSSMDRCGAVVVRAATSEQARAAADARAGLVRITTTADAPAEAPLPVH
ncbi:ATP-grasp domain-containing protein [Yinghuangia seranimata]|uniref:ATP-grasp domain-containing protein n=1 Tax=Yinghuangia seranimata TaxID=408067 RepID=UPI00248C750D|nr:ATP-grasp domain-containing protein [Yinghuangia seranimata]MDI2128354.1 ATP-grasp domain-containing protein [Yinghuangia seranimata]